MAELVLRRVPLPGGIVRCACLGITDASRSSLQGRVTGSALHTCSFSRSTNLSKSRRVNIFRPPRPARRNGKPSATQPRITPTDTPTTCAARTMSKSKGSADTPAFAPIRNPTFSFWIVGIRRFRALDVRAFRCAARAASGRSGLHAARLRKWEYRSTAGWNATQKKSGSGGCSKSGWKRSCCEGPGSS